ncbi:MAG: hypothetical protein WCA46_03995 [Actinocatenispora sp.]
MMTELASNAMVAYGQLGWHHGYGPWSGGPGWWIVFPVLFWVLVLSGIGFLLYRRTPRQVARSSAERTLAERYARGEIDADELRERRNTLRSKA